MIELTNQQDRSRRPPELNKNEVWFDESTLFKLAKKMFSNLKDQAKAQMDDEKHA